MVSKHILIHSKAVKAIIKEIYGKMSKFAILLPQFDPYRGVGGIGLAF